MIRKVQEYRLQLDHGDDKAGEADHSPHRLTEIGIQAVLEGFDLLAQLAAFAGRRHTGFVDTLMQLATCVVDPLIDSTHFVANVLQIFAQVGYGPVHVFRRWL